MNKKLLQLRKRIKTKKPNFVSQDSWKRKRIRKRWQKPKGFQSKIRLHLRGYRKLVSPGYGSPKAVYGLHASGLEIRRVNTESELKSIDKETQGILISSTVGLKKKLSLIKKAKEADLTILNIKDPDSFLKKVEEKLKKKKEEKAKKGEEKKAAEKKKTAKKEKPKLAEKLSEEEKKEAEKREKEKILTKKET